MSNEAGENLPELVAVMRRLLGPDGCPWDQEQTLQTLRQYTIEEAFEVVEAIDSGKEELLREELGDLLFQIVFQTQLTEAKGWFHFGDVIDGVKEKMVRRHPWVFGDQKVDSADGALGRWEAMKAKEKKERGALGGVPVALPALLRAQRVGEKAAAHGYDWGDAAGARAKMGEELAELDAAVAAGDAEAAERELGDLLFAAVSFARKSGMDAEGALRGTLDRFSERFRHAELAAQEEGKALRDLDEQELDALWEAAKAALRAK